MTTADYFDGLRRVLATPNAMNGAANLSYGVQTLQNRYFVALDFDSGEFEFTRYDHSATHVHTTASVSYSANTWYEVEVDWATDGTHTATLYDITGAQLAQVSATDGTWSSGGVGYDPYLDPAEGTPHADNVSYQP